MSMHASSKHVKFQLYFKCIHTMLMRHSKMAEDLCSWDPQAQHTHECILPALADP